MAVKMYFSKKIVSENVRPCPFCGSDDLMITERNIYQEIVKEKGGSMIFLECRGCDTEVKLYDHKDNHKSSYSEGVKKILKKWNERSEGYGIEKDQ